MPFTESERQQVIGALLSRGWMLEEDTIWSPSRGLYFDDSHFQYWSPAELHQVFTRRGERIQRAAFEGWERLVAEHRDVRAATKDILNA